MSQAAGVHKLHEPITGVITDEIKRISSTKLRPGDEVPILGIYKDRSLDTQAGKLGKVFVRLKDEDDQILLDAALQTMIDQGQNTSN